MSIDYDRYKGEPHAFVQWKGTDACMDLYCKCGQQGHVDAGFAYHAVCAECGQQYDVEPYVRLIPVDSIDAAAKEACTVEFGSSEVTSRCDSASPAIDALELIYKSQVLPDDLQRKAWAALRKVGR